MTQTSAEFCALKGASKISNEKHANIFTLRHNYSSILAIPQSVARTAVTICSTLGCGAKPKTGAGWKKSTFLSSHSGTWEVWLVRCLTVVSHHGNSVQWDLRFQGRLRRQSGPAHSSMSPSPHAGSASEISLRLLIRGKQDQ